MKPSLMGLGIGVAVLACAAPAAAQDDATALSLILSCSGTDVVDQSTSVTTSITSDKDATNSATARTSTSQFVRVPARMSVKILDGVLRFRPPDTSRPLLNRPADGWYASTDVAVSDTEISARATYGGLISGKYRLKIDRQTGDVSFGNFRGVCERAVETPSARKF